MNLLRLIFFLPAAIVVAFITSAAFNTIAQFLLGEITILSAILWFFAGGIFSTGWMYAGMKVAPDPKRAWKWIVSGLLLAVSIGFSSAGFYGLYESFPGEALSKFTTGKNTGKILLGIGMFVFALLLMGQTPEELAEDG